MTRLILQDFLEVANTKAGYQLRLEGDLTGTPGHIKTANGGVNDAAFTINQIVLASHAEPEKVFVRAVLPQSIDIPAGLITDANPSQPRRWEGAGGIEEELGQLAAAVRDRFLAHRRERLRRLRTIEIDWESGRFLDATGSVKLRGEAKLALAHFFAREDVVAAEALAEFRATAQIRFTAGGKNFERGYGIAVRVHAAAAAALSLELDDFNLSLPPIDLPSLDLTSVLNLKLPAGTFNGALAGAFSRFFAGFEVEYQWTQGTDPQLVVRRHGNGFLFALAGDDTYNLLAHDPAKLAVLKVTAKRGADFTLTATDVRLAVHSAGVLAEGRLEATGKLSIQNGERALGPLKVAWEGVEITGATDPIKVGAGAEEPDKMSARASVSFRRLTISPIDDPEAVLAVRGTIEINPSGTRVVELALLEPYPIELIQRGAAALMRGGQKIVDILGQLQPKAGDLDRLKKLFEVLGKIASAAGRSSLFVGQKVGDALATAADLLAGAVVKVGEMLAELFKKLAQLFEGDVDPVNVRVDVELRIALDPFELRQVVITLGGPAIVESSQAIYALGVRFEVSRGWRPGLLLDLVTRPGAYLFVVRGGSNADTNAPLATLSTDLWLKRQDNPASPGEAPPPASPASPVRDASAKGTRADKPLLAVIAKPKQTTDRQLFILAGLERGKCIFLQKAKPDANPFPIPGTTLSVTRVEGPFSTEPITDADVALSVELEIERLLPLLGMGEPGASEPPSTGSFLDKLKNSLSQVVTVKKVIPRDSDNPLKDRKVVFGLVLEIQAAGVRSEATLELSLDLDDFEVTLKGPDLFELKSKRIEERALGLTWVVEQTDKDARRENREVNMFRLAFSGGESGLELNKKEARMELRFDGLSSDGQGVVFEVESFRIGRGGLDVTAKVLDRAVRLSGLDVPFRFTSGRFVILGGRLVEAVITGRGQLPPALVGEAYCNVVLAFELARGEIALKRGSKVELEKMGEPIVCHSTRFTLTITNLELGFAKDGGYHFYFLVSGSLRFTPKSGEFEDGLLKFLKDVEISLDKAPLTNDPRVLLRHIRFQKELKPKKSFSLFNLFTFELRGFGFHPASPKFDGRPPAVNISGQIRFANFGDVMQPKIDFHELWIAPPKKGEGLPRIKAEGLGVELQLAGAVKMRGFVLAVDPETRTVEGERFAPEGYNTYGFLGEGALDIPGWCSLEASMGFLEVERQERPGDRKLAFFLYLQANKLAISIPTGFWTFYLREAGFGFGYRYTLAGIKDAENARSTAQLVKILDEVSKRQGDLSRFSAWKPDVEKDNFTLAIRAAFQPYFAKSPYEETEEKTAVSPFFFDIVAALRSDFTLLMSARGWIGINYATFLENKDDFRQRPTFRGYLYISVPRSELLMRGIADSKGFIGQDWPEAMEGSPLRKALQSVDWSTTLYIRPGLLHYEMGWPDQLVVRLVDEPNMRVIVRGGMIFRAAEDGLLFGYNIGAEAFLRFEGRVGSSIGVAVVAELHARFIARVIAYLSFRFKGSLVYGLVSLDARLSFSVRAWMEVDLGFTSFTIRIGFSFSVQFTAAVELAISDNGVGGLVAARVAVRAFGCTLSVGVGFSFNDGQLEAARARVERFLAMSITSEEPDAPPVLAAKKGDEAVDKGALAAEAVHEAPPPPKTVENTEGLKPTIKRSQFGNPIGPTDFHLVLRRASVDPDLKPVASEKDPFVYALLVPQESSDAKRGGFYAAPKPSEGILHTIQAISDLQDVEIWDPAAKKFVGFTGSEHPSRARADAPIPVQGAPDGTFTLALFFDECFIADTEWVKQGEKAVRVASKWQEPRPRLHEREAPSTGSREERDQKREQFQRDRAADAIRAPYDERAYQARSTLMTMFLDQFVTFSASPVRSDANAHVTDLGLVLYGRASEIAKIQHVVKGDESSSAAGDVKVLNPPASWFENQDPELVDARYAVETDGIKLNWRLSMAPDLGDPEHFLHHYEIRRTVEGAELTPEVIRVKPAATIGKHDDGIVKLLDSDWQFVDSLGEETGVSPLTKRALLPTFGGTEGLERITAWFQAKLLDEVTITYSVTPVDISGTRGLPRSFVVDIRRPEVPVRPAVGELRIVQTIADDAEAQNGAQASDTVPDDLRIYLAVNDRAWDDTQKKVTIGDTTFGIERIYRIVVDPEEIEPTGHYGSDASTARLRGPGAFAPVRTRDELKFDVSRKATVAFDSKDAKAIIELIEPDKEEREKLPLWALVDKDPLPGAEKALSEDDHKGLRKVLWSRGGERVASRFFLETVLAFKDQKGQIDPMEHVSRRVALPVEHVIVFDSETQEDLELGRQRIATLRPELFESAVPLVLPPLGEGQVDAESGFARFRVPKAGARLADLHEDENQGLAIQRDAERRVLTTVRFAAVPDWVGAKDAALKPLHGRSLAGFDLYELDIDELAPLDTTAGRKLSLDASAWRRARRVARIEQLPRDASRLVPSGNFDWQGWQAHYPSETERLENGRTGGRPGDSKPIYSAWYSDRETAVCFAERRPRLRLLPLVPEEVISELMRGGSPRRITAWLTAAADTRAGQTDVRITKEPHDERIGLRLPEIRLHPLKVDDINFNERFRDAETGVEPPLLSNERTFERVDAGKLDARDLRALLLCLGWAPFKSGEAFAKYLDAWLKDPGALNGLTLHLRAEAKFESKDENNEPTTKHVVTASTTVALDLRSSLHGVLEEVLAELSFAHRETPTGPALYRRYTVMPQPVTPIAAKDVEAFMAATAPETDPYGWQALQLLGAATTVRLYDAAVDAFLEPDKFSRRAHQVFGSVLERWTLAFGKEAGAVLGQPFAEVYLKPGADRLAGPFEAVIQNANEKESASLRLDDEALAFLQLSLRPRPAAVWQYRKQELRWKAKEERAAALEKPGQLLRGLALRITRNQRDVDVARALGGPVLELRPSVGAGLLPIPPPRSAQASEATGDPELQLFFRLDADPAAAADRPLFELVLEWELVETVEGKVRRTRYVDTIEPIDMRWPFERHKDSEPLEDWIAIDEPADPTVQPDTTPDPFSRFEPVPLDDWTRFFTGQGEGGNAGAAPAAFRALANAAVAAGYTFLDPNLTPDELVTAQRSIVSSFLPWSQRFLEHGARKTNVHLAEPFLALCGPTKATPWKLAADAEGYITLSFLHSDRWGHARAYAVRPITRYHEVLSGIGVPCEEESELVVPLGGKAVGLAVAVSHRTEPIEPPVIVSSRLAATVLEGNDPDSAVEIIVARHSEEALANSNRPLMAHLGMPTSLIAFSRAYNTPKWPERLNEAFLPDAEKPLAIQLPVREASLPTGPVTGIAQINDKHLRDILDVYPNLWKGADVWRVPPLPPHYRLIALASERAGIVVSEVTTVVQDDLPRAPLAGRAEKLLPDPALALQRDAGEDGKRVRLALEHPLISHADLTPAKASGWLKDGGKDDVGFWPDPAVLYVLIRRRQEGDVVAAEEEDVEIRLVAWGDKAEVPPIQPRARGPRYQAVDKVPGGKPVVVTSTATANERSFRLRTSLQSTIAGFQTARLTKTQSGTPEQIGAFNGAAGPFAAILTPHQLEIDMRPTNGELPSDYLDRLKALRTALRTALDGLETALAEKGHPWYDGALVRQARGRWQVLDSFIENGAAAPDVDAMRIAAGLPILLAAPWRRGVELPELTVEGATLTPWTEIDGEQEPGTFLTLYDLAADAEVDHVKAVGEANLPPVARKGGRLYQLLVERVLGAATGFWLKAVDTRTGITIDKDGKPTGTPGVIEVPITKLPRCFQELP